MSDLQIIVTVLVLALSVWITRFLPFMIFKNTDKLPKIIEYSGGVLPAAMMGLLVVYCFKDYRLTELSTMIPALLAVAVVAVLQLIKHNMILSIAAGTVVYMFLLNVNI